MSREWTIFSVVGVPESTAWSQAVNLVRDGKQLVGVLAVSGVNAANVGRELIDELDNTNWEVPAILYQQLDHWRLVAGENQVGLSLALLLQLGDEVTIYGLQGQVILKRDEVAGELLNATTTLTARSGHLHSEDGYVFLTVAAADFANEIQLKLEQGYSVLTVVRSLTLPLTGDNVSAAMAIAAWAQETPTAPVTGAIESPAAPPSESLAPRAVLTTATSTPPSSVLRNLAAKIGLALRQLQPVLSKLVSWLGQILRRLIILLTSAVRTVMSKLPQKSGQATAATTTAKLSWPHIKLTNLAWRLPQLWHSKRLKLALIFLLLLVVLLFGISRVYRSRQLGRELTSALEPIQQNLQAAQTQAVSDPIGARQVMSGSINQLDLLATAYASRGSDVARIAELKSEFLSAQAQIDENLRQQSLPQLVDISQTIPDFSATRGSGAGQWLVLVDADQVRLAVVDLASSTVKLVGPLAEPVRDLMVEDQSLYLLSDGIQQINLTAGLAAEVVPKNIVPAGETNQAATKLAVYDQNIYVFNPEKRNIFRYRKESNGYSAPVGWVSGVMSIAFDQVTDFWIDGDVWLSSDSGAVARLRTGKPLAFTISGLAEGLTNPTLLSSTTDTLLILEPARSRLVTINKSSGNFVKEQRSPSLGAATVLVALDNRVLAVNGSLVYLVGE